MLADCLAVMVLLYVRDLSCQRDYVVISFLRTMRPHWKNDGAMLLELGGKCQKLGSLNHAGESDVGAELGPERGDW